MFIAALFTMAKIEKPPRCPSTDEWLQKMWCIKNGILFSCEREGTWMDLGVSQVAQW